ncbi:type VI secretion system lipoprotein TssJ [Alkalilimnicola sp. S0819]|uniref:type VI secretion system lipoprotein TssJ n=1 Tax=Alkalilimnicola sp. S0819 TaxID=2613922 RepID=UPI0012616316|nr:type VI secretion system lipoprotein TssJ [Alkalilimnicola sp. S0819]KAB7622619.1 type VI secretion system lipoprotein TssJ [Alkalilimnicola sp. S0819]MPQ17390.1 type VI secretion system lipoprotein TssJ [Alkalilimnicola sp. S0819]
MPLRVIASLMLGILLSACAANRAVLTPYERLKLQASTALNPDVEQVPSPLSLRVYQLSERTSFDNLDFDAAWDHAPRLLGEQLRAARERTLQPGETLHEKLELDPRTRHIALVAAYRDIAGSRWRLVYDVNPHWYQSHRVVLKADGLMLAED